ncbi:MAG: phosphopantetheine-binding protein, partial [Rikenellaceae bacterium]
MESARYFRAKAIPQEVNDVAADFFALGGHSLLAMKLAAQLSRVFERQVTPGQVMVASTVEQLS